MCSFRYVLCENSYEFKNKEIKKEPFKLLLVLSVHQNEALPQFGFFICETQKPVCKLLNFIWQ